MGAEGVIDQRLGMVKSAHLRRRTMMGSCSRDLVWGDATRHANLGIVACELCGYRRAVWERRVSVAWEAAECSCSICTFPD